MYSRSRTSRARTYSSSTALVWKSWVSWACFSKRSICLLNGHGGPVVVSGSGQRLQDLPAIGPTEQILAAPLGVRHEPDNVAGLVRQARDVRGGSVRVRLGRRRAARVGVAEHDLPVRLHPRERELVGDPAALAMRDRHANDLAAQARGERRAVALDAHVHPVAAELEVAVADERARQESDLAEDLEPVARAEDRHAFTGGAAQLRGDRRDRGDRARAQVIAVREAAGNHRRVVAAQVGVGVPEDVRLRADERERMREVHLAPRPREAQHRDAHAHSAATSTANSSITGFASSSSPIFSATVRAADSSAATNRTTISLPVRTSATSIPSDRSAPATASPCGSRTSAFGRTRVVATESVTRATSR